MTEAETCWENLCHLFVTLPMNRQSKAAIKYIQYALNAAIENCAVIAALPPNCPIPITGEHRRLWQIAADAIRKTKVDQ